MALSILNYVPYYNEHFNNNFYQYATKKQRMKTNLFNINSISDFE